MTLKQTNGGEEIDFLPRCSADACRSGRRPCPTPQACQLPIDADSRWAWLDDMVYAARWVAAGMLFLFILAAAGGYFFNR
jgi:hypothetical protein